ncbi:MAG: alanine racemase, partial [Pseudomonadota bacterium]
MTRSQRPASAGLTAEAPPPAGGGWVDVDLSALAANYDTLVRLVAPAACAATVKADAYGLGLEAVTNVLWERGCRTFFVANLAEAMALRRLQPTADVLVFNGVVTHEVQTMVNERIWPRVQSVKPLVVACD